MSVDHEDDTLTKTCKIDYIFNSVTGDDTLTKMDTIVPISNSVTERKASRDNWVAGLCEYGQEYHARRRLFLCSSHLQDCRQCWEARQILFRSIHGDWRSETKEVACKCGRSVFFRGDRKTHLLCFDCDLARRQALQAAWRAANIPKAAEVSCDYCGTTFQPKRSTAKFCSTRCRVAANRAIGKGGAE